MTETIAPASDAVARVLLEGALEASLLLAVAAIAAFLLRRTPAQVRARLLMVGLLAALLAPALDAWIPGRALGLLPQPFPASTASSPLSSPAGSEVAIALRASDVIEAPSTAIPLAVRTPRRPTESAIATPAVVTWGESEVSREGRANPAMAPIRRSPAATVLAIWAAGASAVLGWQALGLFLAWRITRRARALDLANVPGASSVPRVFGRTRILESAEVATPVTWGLLRPVVLLPVAARSWSSPRLAIVLEHELAHVSRGDWAVRSLARLAVAVYWFHPLAWLVHRRLVLEQELACDEAVVALGHRRSDYAEQLLSLVRVQPRTRLVPVAVLEMARRSQMEVRLMSILDPRTKLPGRLAIPAFAAIAVLVPALAAMRPWQNLEVAQAPPARSATVEPGGSLASVAAELASLEAELEPFERQLEELERGLEPSEAELEAIEASVTPSESQLESVEGELAPLQERLEALEAQLAPFEGRLEATELELEPFEGRGDRIETELEPLEQRLRELEESLRPHEMELARLESEMEPVVEALESKAERLEEAHRRGSSAGSEQEREQQHAEMAELQRRLEPFREQMEAVHRAMEPVHQQMQSIHEQMEPVHGRMQQIHEQMEPVHRRMEQLHREMEPVMRQMQQIHQEMEPIHRRMQAVHEQMEPVRQQMQQVHERMEPIHRQMQQVHERMEPIHRRMQETHERLHQALRADVRRALEAELTPADYAGRDLDAIAGALAETLGIESEDGRLWVRGSRRELREVLARELGGAGTSERVARINAAVDRVLDLEAPIDSRR